MNEANNNFFTMKPFVKWAGGKRQMIKHIKPLLPKTYENYIEPFVGGGALLFHLKPESAIINDINSELFFSYSTIKDNYIELCKILDSYQKKHSEEFYYQMRDYKPKKIVNVVARFLYLNKSCFNGLYRVNSTGKFNVPFNQSKTVNIYEKENMKNISHYLSNNNINIFNEDFLITMEKAKIGDFIFCDPPYDTDTKQFTSYSENSFGKKEQLDLANKLKELDKKKIKWMLTNHDTDYVKELYNDFNIKIVSVNRNINSNGKKRKNSSNEVIVTNYNEMDK